MKAFDLSQFIRKWDGPTHVFLFWLFALADPNRP